MNRRNTTCLAIAAVLASPPLLAQHAGHAMPAQARSQAPAPASNEEPDATAPAAMEGMDHSTMDHGQMPGMDHARMDQGQMRQMQHASGDLPVDAAPREPIPAPSDADRAAAFPAVHVHHRHGTSIHRYALIDRLEVSDADPGTAWAWEASGWIGGDVQRFWWRTEGHAIDGSVDGASLEALYGRGVRAWWDVIAGVRHETGEGPDRTWVAFGVQGLAPGKFEVSATAYAGQGGRTALRGEAEYDTLLSNRVILQWRAEAEAHGKDDPQHRIGSGLSTVAAGVRLRYELDRRFAPYIGIERGLSFGRTADLRRADREPAHDTRVVAGVRIWF